MSSAQWKLLALAATISISIGSCAAAPASAPGPPELPTLPPAGRLTVSLQAAPCVGEVVPVYVSVANGTEKTRTVVPSQIFALNDVGERIAPLPPAEAARQAGDANELRAAIQSGAIGGIAGGVGAAASTMAPTASLTGGISFHSPGGGALAGTGFAGESGVINGAGLGQSTADQQASEEIDKLSLRPEAVRHNVVSGYVFFPKGSYEQVEMVLVDRDGVTETVREAWR